MFLCLKNQIFDLFEISNEIYFRCKDSANQRWAALWGTRTSGTAPSSSTKPKVSGDFTRVGPPPHSNPVSPSASYSSLTNYFPIIYANSNLLKIRLKSAIEMTASHVIGLISCFNFIATICFGCFYLAFSEKRPLFSIISSSILVLHSACLSEKRFLIFKYFKWETFKS